MSDTNVLSRQGSPSQRGPRTSTLPFAIALGASALIGAPSSATDFLVDSTADLVDVSPGDGICDADPGAGVECTLRAAIMEANALPNGAVPDTVFVPGGTYTLSIAGAGEDLAATGDLDVTERLNVIGDPAARPVIDGNGIDRVLDAVSGVGLYLEDLRIRGGSASGAGVGGSGGGVRTWIPIALLDCELSQNEAEQLGGGLHSENGDLTFLRSLVEDNEAANGAGVAVRFATVVLSNVTLRGNRAIPGSSGTSGGGGIDLSGSVMGGDQAYIVNSFILGNEATFGAGINTSMQTLVINTTVSGNETTFGGGSGIRTFDELRLVASTVHGNRSVDGSNAPALYLQGGSASIFLQHTIVSGNTDFDGAANCPVEALESGGYNLVGDSTGCSFTGTTTGHLLDVDPQLHGPVAFPTSQGTAGGRPALAPRSTSPVVDAGNPLGILYDHDFSGATADLVDDEDGWLQARPYDGDGDGTARPDIGAIEFRPLFTDGFESGDTSAWM